MTDMIGSPSYTRSRKAILDPKERDLVTELARKLLIGADGDWFKPGTFLVDDAGDIRHTRQRGDASGHTPPRWPRLMKLWEEDGYSPTPHTSYDLLKEFCTQHSDDEPKLFSEKAHFIRRVLQLAQTTTLPGCNTPLINPIRAKLLIERIPFDLPNLNNQHESLPAPEPIADGPPAAPPILTYNQKLAVVRSGGEVRFSCGECLRYVLFDREEYSPDAKEAIAEEFAKKTGWEVDALKAFVFATRFPSKLVAQLTELSGGHEPWTGRATTSSSAAKKIQFDMQVDLRPLDRLWPKPEAITQRSR